VPALPFLNIAVEGLTSTLRLVNRSGFSKLKRLQEQAIAFFHERGLDLPQQPRQSVLFRFAHFWLMVAKSFIRNRCPVRASALAYTTLLALVPLLAVGVSITTSLLQKEGDKPIRTLIDDLVKNVAPALDLQASDGNNASSNRNEVVSKITDYIANIQSGALGVTSTVALVFVAIGLLRTIEAAFNDIWGVTTGRGWIASVIQYWATITLGPVILVVVLGLTTGPTFQRVLYAFRSQLLTTQDIKDFPSFAKRLSQKADPLSEHLAGLLEPAFLKDLGTVSTNMPLSEQRPLAGKLVDSLNQIIRGVSIYEERRFATVTLEPKTKALIDRKPEGRELALLNRQLLDVAYPYDLKHKTPPLVENVAFQVLPFVVLSLAFAVFYQLMPNTQVQWRAALAGGVVGGTLWLLNNKLSVLWVSKTITYSKIYGSLGIIPLMLIGMYFSWLILLFGAQVAYAFQNRKAYLEEKQSEGVNQRGKEFIAIRVMTQIARCFAKGEPPPTVAQLAESLGVPTKLASRLLGILLHARLVAEVVDGDTGYVPARPIDDISAQDILHALRVGSGHELETHDDGMLALVRGEYERIRGAEKDVAAAITLGSLVRTSKS
jgi:YihY family inner membrane protein